MTLEIGDWICYCSQGKLHYNIIVYIVKDDYYPYENKYYTNESCVSTFQVREVRKKSESESNAS